MQRPQKWERLNVSLKPLLLELVLGSCSKQHPAWLAIAPGEHSSNSKSITDKLNPYPSPYDEAQRANDVSSTSTNFYPHPDSPEVHHHKRKRSGSSSDEMVRLTQGPSSEYNHFNQSGSHHVVTANRALRELSKSDRDPGDHYPHENGNEYGRSWQPEVAVKSSPSSGPVAQFADSSQQDTIEVLQPRTNRVVAQSTNGVASQSNGVVDESTNGMVAQSTNGVAGQSNGVVSQSTDYPHTSYGGQEPDPEQYHPDSSPGVVVIGPKRKRNFSNRTKTGCLTCRHRKKKCDEQRPWCELNFPFHHSVDSKYKLS